MSATELESMIVRLLGDGTAYVKMMADAARATKEGVDQIGREAGKIEGFTHKLEGFAESVKGLFEKVGIGLGLREAMEQFEAFELSMTRLEATIRTTGESVEETMGRFKEFAKVTAENTTASQGATMHMVQQAMLMGNSAEQAQRATREAIALAAAKGGEAESYIRATAMMQRGEYFYAQHILGLRHVTDESKILAQYMNTVATGMSVEHERAQTLDATINRFKHSIGTLVREVGGMVASVLGPLLNAANSIIAAFNALDPIVKKMVSNFMLLAAAVKPVLWAYESVAGITGRAAAAFGMMSVAAGSAEAKAAALTRASVLLYAKLAAVAAVLIGVKELALWIGDDEKMKDKLKEWGKATDQALSHNQKEFGKVLEGMPGREDPKERAEKLKESIEKYEKELDKVKGAEESLKKMREGITLGPLEWLGSHVLGGTSRTDVVKEGQKQVEALKDQKEGFVQQLKDMLKEISDPRERLKTELAKSLKQVEKEVRQFGMTPEDKRLDDLRHEGANRQIEDYRKLEEAMRNLNDMKAEEDLAKKQIEDERKYQEMIDHTKDALINEINALELGGEKGELWRLQMKNMNEETAKFIRNLQLQEEALKMSDEALDPVTKFNKGMEHLNAVMETGKLSAEAYRKQVGKLRQEMVGAVESWQAVEFGGAEFYRRLDKYREGLGQSIVKAQPKNPPLAGVAVAQGNPELGFGIAAPDNLNPKRHGVMDAILFIKDQISIWAKSPPIQNVEIGAAEL